MKIQKKVLRDIYRLNSILGRAEAEYSNDRNPNRAEAVHSLLREGLIISQNLINSQPYLEK